MKNSKVRVPAVQHKKTRITVTSLAEERHGEADELERFIYRASHDLRGPLSRLMGLCNVAALEVNDVQALNYLYRIACAASEMDEMLHKVLKVELVKQKEINIAPVSLPEIVVDIIGQALKEEGQPQLSYEIVIAPALIYTDAFLLELAIENLIRNAVQYRITSARVNPHITVTSHEDDGWLTLTITDNGTGDSS